VPKTTMPKEDTVELRWILSVIRRWLWLIVVCVLLGTVGTLIVTFLMPPIFGASAVLFISADQGTTTSDLSAINASERLVLTYSQMLTGRPVMDEVIGRLGLAETPDSLAKRVAVTPIKDTQLIQLSVQDGDPARAALIANTAAESFVDQVDSFKEVGLRGRVMVMIYQTAQAPDRPISHRSLYTMLAALVSAVVALGIAFLFEYLDNTIKSSDDVSRVLGLPTLGAIGRLAKGEDELVMVAQPRSPVAETFRMLCTNIRFLGMDKPLRVLLVTSPAPREGKSFAAANLAAAMAQTGLRVAIVDADLHCPRLHQLFGLEFPINGKGRSAPVGLTGSLMTGYTDGRLCSTQTEGLMVLPSGELPPNPVEMMGSQRLRKLLDDLAQQVDVVVIDTPPVLAVADVVALAPAVDGVLLVVQAGLTPRASARRAADSLRQVGANLIGVVLNAVSPDQGGYYDYDKYYQDGAEQQERQHRRQLHPMALVQKISKDLRHPQKRDKELDTRVSVQTVINGEPIEFLCEPRQSLLTVLRETLGLTGAREECDDGNCGECSVIMDGVVVKSCLMLAVEAEGKSITTAVGIALPGGGRTHEQRGDDGMTTTGDQSA
jgi:succinoglycan biosynthesis transport protein ExoP